MNNNKDSKKFLILLQDIQLSLKSEAGDVEILKKINFSASKGEIIGITGPSGAGKTSLMMLISGLEESTSGKMHIAGSNICSMNEDELTSFRQKNIGIVFQSFHLIPTMTALENVSVPLEFMYDKEAIEKSKEALNKVGLADRIYHYPSQLSGGEQQRVALARSFVTDPKIILADEPTGNLDIETGKKVTDLLFETAKTKETTLIIVTHDVKLAKRCDRIVNIKDGIIIDA